MVFAFLNGLNIGCKLEFYAGHIALAQTRNTHLKSTQNTTQNSTRIQQNNFVNLKYLKQNKTQNQKWKIVNAKIKSNMKGGLDQ